ncbi:MAG TPA: hypothetical protein VHD14_04820 [Pseudolabrys sp.]|nr:hypothetical protein [Pseudolabrys sp.]
MSAVKSHAARTEITPAIIAIVLVLGVAALVGGNLVLRKQQPMLTIASEDITNSAGRASYPLADGSTCREVAFDRVSGEIISSFTHPCKDNEPKTIVRRKFSWGR